MTRYYYPATSQDTGTSTTQDPGLLLQPAAVQPTGGPVLTVGAGEMFATLGAALNAATDGTTILVDAGTYTNDFGIVTAKVTIAGVGGMANFVATEAPTDQKGILTVDNDVTIANCSFSGAAVSDDNGGNGAGIRYEGGQMVLENDSFSNNQDGVLGAPVIAGLTNTVSVDHCLFQNNGSGSGYTHNFYMGNVASLSFTNNISEGAVVGHEFKSRAYVNDIENNVFMDGPAGTASYSIDLPDGGTDTVLDNTIEKGPMAQNNAAIHFGGEGIPYAGSSLLVAGNVFQNDYGAGEIGVLNQTSIGVTIQANQFVNFAASTILQGPGTATGDTDGQGNALADQTLTGVLPGNTLIITDSAAHTVSLTGTLLAVEGGAGLLTVTAIAGHVVAIGGSGGMNFSESNGSGGNSIATLAGASDALHVTGQDLIDSEGNDNITIGACNVSATLNGVAFVSDGTGNDQFIVGGTATITGHGGNPVVSVGSAGSAVIGGTVGFLHVIDNGGNFRFSVTQGGATETLTDTGGALDAQVANGTISVTTAGGPAGSTLRFGAGAASVLSVGADTIYAGSGTETVIVEGAAAVYAGTGALSLYGRSDSAGATLYGAGGTYTIAGDTGNIAYVAGARASTVQAVLSNITLVGGAGRLSVNGGSNDVMAGGAGGLAYTATDGGGGNTIITMAGARDTLTLAGTDTVVANGTDTVNAGTGNQLLAVTGNSTVNGSSGNSWISFSGTDTLNGVGYDQCTATAGATLTVNAGSNTIVSETQATVKFSLGGSTPASVIVTGGAAGIAGGTAVTAGINVATLAGASTVVTLTTGTDSVISQGTDQLHAGTGADTVALQGGACTVWGGAGTLTVLNQDASATDTQTVIGGRGAISVQQAGGALSFIGGAGAATLAGGGGQLFVTGGAGALTVTGGDAGFQITAGTGALTATLGHGGGSVTFGAGNATVQVGNWGAGDVFDFNAGHAGGTDTIGGFRAGTDSLVFNGVSVTSETVASGATRLVLSDNTHVVLSGFADTQGLF